MTKKYLRHGDVSFHYLKEIDKSKLDEIETQGNEFVIAEGEATGHIHRIKVKDRTTKNPFKIYKDESGKMILEVLSDGVEIEHWNKLTNKPAEHKTLTFSKGYYLIEHEERYNPFTEELEKVID